MDDAGGQSGRVTPFIIDCDPGVDDILALLLAALSSEVDILAYTVNFGNTTADNGARNILKMYHALEKELETNSALARRATHLQRRKPILAIGAKDPLEGQVFHASYYHGADGLASIDTKRPDLSPKDLASWMGAFQGLHTDGASGPQHKFVCPTGTSAHKVILELLKSHESGTITLVALGPLTNLALALQADAEIFRRVRQIVVMGGALSVPGNVGPNSEFNFYADPAAARCVISATPPLPLLLLPLDITAQHLMARSLYITHIKSRVGKSPLCDFLSAFLDRTFEISEVYNAHGIEMHDPLAMAVAIAMASTVGSHVQDPALLHAWQSFDIEVKGELTRGMCVVDRRMDAALQKGQARSESRLFDHERRKESDQGVDVGVSETLLAGGSARKDIDDGSAETREHTGPGSRILTGTSGSNAFNQSWFERVLGVDLGYKSMISRQKWAPF